MNHKEITKTLVITDECTIINAVYPTQLFVYGRQLNIDKIYLLQKYMKVLSTIKENNNVYACFKQYITFIKDFIYKTIGDKFENKIEIKIVFR